MTLQVGGSETLSSSSSVEFEDNPYAGWGDEEQMISELEHTPEVDIEEVKGQLIEFFGPSQQFSYMSHRGTVVDMMNLCTGIDHILQGGFDVAKEWLSSYTVFETNEEDTNDKEADDTSQVEVDTSKDIHDKASSDQVNNGNESKNEGIHVNTLREQSVQQAVDHAKQAAEESISLVAVIAPAIIDLERVEEIKESVKSEVAISPAVVTADQSHVHSSAQNESVKKPTEITVENSSNVESEQFTGDSSVDSEKNESIRQAEDIQDEMSLLITLAVNNNVVDQEVAVEKAHASIEPVSVEITESVTVTETELAAKGDNDVEALFAPDDSEMTAQESDPTPLLVYDEIKETTSTNSEMTWNNDSLKVNTEEINAAEVDRESGYVNTVDIDSPQQLNTQQYGEAQQSVDELKDLEYDATEATSINVIIKRSVSEVYQKLYIEQDVIVDEIANMVGEQPTEQQTADAAYIAMEQAQKIEQSIALLNHAKTGQECADYLQEIREELAGLLHVLGYKNVDMLVERLFKVYDVKTLRQFMVNLIIANSQAQQAGLSLAIDSSSYSRLGRQVVALLVHPRRLAWA